MRKPLIQIVGCAVAAVFVLAGSLAAQQQKGDKELSIGGNLQYMTIDNATLDEGDTSLFGSIFGSLGLFATRSVKLSVGTALTISSPAGSDTNTSGLLNYGASYYFGGPGAKTYPYVGVGGTTQISSSDEASSETNVTGIVGLQHYFSRNASLFGEVSYTPLEGATLIPISFGFRVIF